MLVFTTHESFPIVLYFCSMTDMRNADETLVEQRRREVLNSQIITDSSHGKACHLDQVQTDICNVEQDTYLKA